VEGLLWEAHEGSDREAGGAAKEVPGGHREERARACGKRRSVENARDAKDQQGKGDSGTREVHCCGKRRCCYGISAEDGRTSTRGK